MLIIKQTLLKYVADDELLLPEEALNAALEHTKNLAEYTKSKKFQWLPSEFRVDESGAVQISSYINNLHPEHHPKLYSCIEKIFEKFVPMFNKVLTGMRNPLKNRIVIDDYYATFEYAERKGEEAEEIDSDLSEEEPEKIRKLLDIPVFEPHPNPEKVVLLNGRNLQVIVKLANIHLTPNQPEYPGMLSNYRNLYAPLIY